ncbi:MAG: dehydrogenase [Prevotella sp.]|jgi:hypothetical protein|nr:dehydrogenase [Prevotella sp.]
MADNYLEYRREAYERRKEEWLRKQGHLPRKPRRLEKPDDEAL